MKNQAYFLLLLAFVEGAAVMVCELLGAKLIGPYFGGSLYVWASALGVTLGALMTGYYLGGVVSAKGKNHFVYWALLIAGLLLLLMPKIGHWTMGAILASNPDTSVQTGSVLSLLVFMFPQLVLFGMTSPLIINTLNQGKDQAGKMAGSVYAISTLGGIIATFLMGFYLLPELGVYLPAVIFGLLLMVLGVVGLLLKKRFIGGIMSSVLILIGFINLSHESVTKTKNYTVHYSSDGILGQVKVVDQMYATPSRGIRPGRILYVNNTAQTIMSLDDPNYSLWDWAYYFPAAASVFPKKSKALLLGLGGGTLVKQFNRLNFELDVVELDERIKDVTLQYFDVDPQTNIIVDDGRHYINTTQEKYDVITLDVFISETPPAHLISVESFKRMKKILNPGGMIMMNFYGYLSGSTGRSGRSVYQTFQAAGFDTKLFITPGPEQGRNLIFLACTEPMDFSNCTYTEPGFPVLGDITNSFVNPETLDMSDAVVLTDDVPILEKMYLECALDWRKGTNAMSTQHFIREGIE